MSASDSVALVTELDTMVASFTEAHPDFVAELEVLGIAVEDYQRMLAENQPVVITSSSTSSR